MSAPAAFRATYSDFKLIKTRQVVQFVFEVPLEKADEAYQVVGGMPDPAKESWFAIAKLVDEKTKPAGKVATEKRLVQQAAIACTEPLFLKFLQKHDEDKMQDILADDLPADATDEMWAAEYVRHYCGVKSRSEIILGSPAAERWDRLWGQFLVWKQT